MSYRHVLRPLLSILIVGPTLAIAAISLPAFAQDNSIKNSPVLNPQPDINGVDLIFGTFATQSPFIASVPAAGQLSAQYSFNGRRLSSELEIYIIDKSFGAPAAALGDSANRSVTLYLGGEAKIFHCPGSGVCDNLYKPDGGILSIESSGSYNYTDKNGNKYQFFAPISWFTSCGEESWCDVYGLEAHVREINYTNGERIKFSPQSLVTQNGGNVTLTDTASSNLGYNLSFSIEVPVNSNNSVNDGVNWLSHLDSPRSIKLTKSDFILSRFETRRSLYGQNNQQASIIQTDIINRTYKLDLKADGYLVCNSMDYTNYKPIRVETPGGIVTNVEYSFVGTAGYDGTRGGVPMNGSGDGNVWPVKSVTRGSSTWTYNWGTTVRVTDPLGGTRDVDVVGGRVPRDEPSGCINYTDRGTITRSSDPLFRVSRYGYNSEDRVTKSNLPKSNGYSYEYDARGNVTKVRQCQDIDCSINLMIFEAGFSNTCLNLSVCNQPLWVRDARGNQTDYVYDELHGQVLSVTSPPDASGLRAQTRYTYSAYDTGDGILYRKVTKSTCASVANCVGTPDELKTTFTYSGSTFLPSSTREEAGDGSGSRTTTFSYDLAGRELSRQDPRGQISYSRYDLAGRLTGHIAPADANGNHRATRISYNPDDQITVTEEGSVSGATDADWASFTVISRTETRYDGVGQRIAEIKFDGSTPISVTQYGYDLLGRLECTAIRMNPSSYNNLSTPACSLGVEGSSGPDRITRNVYDAAGQMITEKRGYGSPIQQDYVTYTYDANGKRTSVRDANGNLSQLTYDGFDRQTAWIFPSKTIAGAVDDNDYEAYGYDVIGNRTRLRKRDGRTITYTYDALNRMTSKILPDGCSPIQVGTCAPSWALRSVYYGYDLRGLQTYARFDSASGEGIANAYDIFGRLVSSATTLGGQNRALTFQYDANGNRTRITHPDGTSFEQAYDALNRPTSTSQPDGVVIANAVWNVQGLIGSLDKIGAATHYSYDGIGRLTSQSQALVSNGLNTTLTYNPANQIASETRDNSAYAFAGRYDVDRGYAVNGQNQYTGAGSVGFQYDANGNLYSDGTTSYVYDAENRLVSTSAFGGTNLAYDPLGRLWQISNPSGTTRLLYDGDQLTAEYDSSGNTLRRYVHGGAEDDPLVWYEGAGLGDRRSLMADRQGSIVAAVSAGGNPIRINTYDEYGIPGASNLGRFQYTGQVWLPELGMYHYKARLYSPTLGRFLQTDPIGYDDQLNLYAYVANDPVNQRDPSGLEAACVTNGGTCTDPKLTWSDIGNRLLTAATVVAVAIDILDGPTPDIGAAAVAARTARAERIAQNAAQGARGEAATAAKLGDRVAGKQVSFKASDGTRTRADFVTKGREVVETKTGNAKLTSGQQKLHGDINAGRPVTPVGQNARDAGLRPGEPIRMKGCSVERPSC